MATRKQPVRTCVACRREADKRELVRFVREAGRVPVQRDTLYDEVRRFA